MKKITVKEKNIDQRLDVCLSSELSVSRSVAQKYIKGGLVKVNSKPANSHYQTKAGDLITIDNKTKTSKEKDDKKALPEIPIIKETSDYFVINKPAGVLMHGTENDSRLTLVDWLLKKHPKISKIGEDPARPGIVHRLDKDVSGLVVIAKTQKFFDEIKKQFQERTVQKHYTALAYGENFPNEGEIRFKMERSSKGYKMAAKPLNQEGKLAITEFSVIKCFYNYTLLSLKIKTGRTHQIRASLAAYNHSLVGDDLYGTLKDKIHNKKFKLGRVFLVATDLSFIDLSGERQSFSVDLPKELQKVLDSLKLKN